MHIEPPHPDPWVTALIEHLRSAPRNLWGVVPRVTCRDGFSVSIQASRHSYCDPRTDEGPWSAVELGYPSVIEPLIWRWAESPGRWTDTVYPWVPIEVAAAVIECHGGIAEKSTEG